MGIWHIAICGLPRSTVFSTQMERFKKNAEHNSMFEFAVQVLFERVLVQKEMGEVRSRMFAGLYVKCLLCDFNSCWICSSD
jgi:hypothetical protein